MKEHKKQFIYKHSGTFVTINLPENEEEFARALLDGIVKNPKAWTLDRVEEPQTDNITVEEEL